MSLERKFHPHGDLISSMFKKAVAAQANLEQVCVAGEVNLTEGQRRTPFFEALLQYVRDGVTPFHCPGHKQGKGVHEALRSYLGKDPLAIDLTEVLGLDDLQQPEGVLKEAQDLAARAYGADFSYFLVNGTTSGVQIMIMATCSPGDTILVPRNAHKSVQGGLIFSGARPVYMMPEFDEELQIDHTVTIETLQTSLKRYPECKAVLLVSPTYYGVCTDLQRSIELCHDHGKIVLVDEAWGPHFHFHPDLPPSATSLGADLVVNSTHKLLSSFTQSSMLHLKGSRVDRGRLESVYRLLTSTSPSMLLLASLDVSRMQMATSGKELLDSTIALAERGRREIARIPGLQCFGKEVVGRPGACDFDPTKLTVTARDLGYTGYQVEAFMRKERRIQLEMAEIFNTVSLITIGTTEEDLQKLIEGFRSLALHDSPSSSPVPLKNHTVKLPEWPPQRLSPREAFDAPHGQVPLREAAGRIAVELLTPYPPGIPILCPGEEITQEIIEYMLLEIRAGSHLTGFADSTFQTVRVVR